MSNDQRETLGGILIIGIALITWGFVMQGLLLLGMPWWTTLISGLGIALVALTSAAGFFGWIFSKKN